MGHVKRTQMDHYAAPAISCNHNENMVQLIAEHMGYPEVHVPQYEFEYYNFRSEFP